MSVDNVKVVYIRPEYENLKEWMANKNNIYIGRGRIVYINKQRYPEKDSIFANPFKINDNQTREKALELYEQYIRDKITNNPYFKTELLNLKGKNLGCWCKPEPCHGDILLRLINEFDKK